MASSSLRIASTPSSGLIVDQVAKLSIQNLCHRNLAGVRPCVVAFGDQSRFRWTDVRISAAPTVAMTATTTSNGLKNQMSLEPYQAYDEQRGKDDVVDASDRLDEWMRNSVAEIVKNLRDAPLLVQVYPKRKKNQSSWETMSLATEKKAVVDDWPVLKGKWETGQTSLPEGIIFVEELAGDEAEQGGKEERTTRVWGLVVQGKGFGCGPVCYLLKTTRVESGPGTGLCCTHFFLMRVRSFWETVDSQLKNCWLLQSQ